MTLRLFLLLALCATAVHAAPTVSKDAQGVTVATAAGVTRVEVWGDRILHVTHRADGAPPAGASLTVVGKPGSVNWTATDDGLTTPALKVTIGDDGAVRIADTQGAAILIESIPYTGVARQSFALDPAEAIIGLGQHQNGVMNYVGTSVHLQQKNTDVAVPVLLSSKGYAVLWDNPAITDVDVGKTDKSQLTWTSEAGAAVDYYLFYGPEPDRAIAGYRALTGAAPMLGKWAWGLWQSRERYKSQQELLDVVAEYRKRGIPLDGIIQDWRYWDPAPWGSHEFDTQRYADPAGLLKTLHAEGIHLLISVWPKFDAGSPNLAELEKAGVVYDPVLAYVYPRGAGKWYDPFSAEGRRLYWKQVSEHLFSLGIDGWWLDASEPELTGKWGEFRDFKTAAGPGAAVFNAYPLLHTTGVYQGQRAETPDKRVVILTRSAYAGQQRNAAITWSGDIHGKWDVLAKQIPAGLNFAASGIPYWNTDIGGFFGSNPDDPKYVELFTRWFQFGSFNPMFRIHGTDKPKEIWRFDEPTQKILTEYDNLRYRLLPYLYSLSWRVTDQGYTMMRPLLMDFRGDSRVYPIADQYMFGPAIMVCPVVKAGAVSRSVYLPAGPSWTDFWTGKPAQGRIEAASPIETMPLFIRAGSILPCGPAVQYAMEKPADPIELRVYRGADGDFTLYEDEGDNYNYEKGAHAEIPLHWDEAKETLTLGARRGSFPGMLSERTFRIVWVSEAHGAGIAATDKPDAEVRYLGVEMAIPMPHPRS